MGNSGLKQHYETATKTGALRLSQRKLDEFPPNLISLASQLRTLDLSENRFVKLPEEIGKFSALKQLNLSSNRLMSLPESIGCLTKLEILNCSRNQLSQLPSSLSKLTHLKQANFSDNRIGQFPLPLCGLKHLDVLDLSRNQITVLPDAVAGLFVTELIVNQNQISSLSEKLAECPRLKTLRLEENCLQANNIPARLLKESTVSILALEGNLFEMKRLAEIDGYDAYMERYTAVKKKMF